ncbi:MAG: large-conductance mechanosensitive channel protein MscL [Dysgonamonadaceae bacterium]|jgi:large conductance mechanosensitive channel|nr:large-conductance mechanosensitive channel protein MscL [Dysgonamonadaceae bacterium]
MAKTTLLKEFKEFAMRGNVIDMAVGVVIGGAFGKIISSLVADVIMPLIGVLVGGINFTDLKWTIKKAIIENGTETAAAVTLNYGTFLQTALDFLIVAFCIFMFIKLINSFKRKKEAAPATPPAPSKEELLLTEIRDILKEKK